MPSEAYALPLMDYAAMVWRRRVLVVLIVAAMTVPAVVLSRAQTPLYEASGDLLLSQQQLDADFNISAGDLTDRQMDAQVRILLGVEVAAVAEQNGARSPVTASALTLSNAILIRAQDSDPRRAAKSVNTFAEAFIEVRRQQVRDTLDAAARQLQRRIDLLEKRIDPLLKQIRGAAPGERDQVQASVQPLQTGLQQQQATLESLQGQLQVQRALSGSGATLVQPAVAPTSPVSPKPFRDGALAAVLGLVLSISVVVLLETARLRKSMQRHRQAQTAHQGEQPGAGPDPRDDEGRLRTLISRT